MMWNFDVTISTPAGALPVLDGAFAWDRGWAPLGQGSFTVPLAAWTATGLNPLTRYPLTISILTTNYRAGSILWDDLPGATLGETYWPTQELRTYDGTEPLHAMVHWHVFLRSVEIDRRQQTATLNLQTFEMLMTEMVNTDIPWMPSGVQGGHYDAADVLKQMFQYTGIHVPINVTTTSVIPPETMEPWGQGQDAWSYWDRVRTLGELGAYYNPTTGIVTIEAARNFVGTVPSAPLDHVEEYGTSDFDSAQYADALTVNWKWTKIIQGEVVEFTQMDTRYADGLSDWRNARNHLSMDRIGPPVSGFAQRAVNNLYRFKTVHRVTIPMTPLLIAQAPGLDWQGATFDFGDEPVVTLTILTS